VITLLVVAKAPVPGQVKTRLCPPLTPHQAATLAAAALLDTLDVVETTADHLRGSRPTLALTGDLDAAIHGSLIRRRLIGWRVVRQRGDGFASRLVNAHLDAAGSSPVFQLGMDSPQVRAETVTSAARSVLAGEACIGPAADGGWWGLGLPRAGDARTLRQVVMSTDRTLAQTVAALRRIGVVPSYLPRLTDVDTFDDATAVAAVSTGHFAQAVGIVLAELASSAGMRPADVR